MLPDSIVQHAYFHADLTEQTAKAYLLANKESNFLFCAGSKPNTITLVYTSIFKNNTEVEARSMPNISFSQSKSSLIHFNRQMINVNDTARSSLYNIAEYLAYFLKGWTEILFTPIALPRTGLTAEEFATMEAQYKAESLAERQHITEQQQKLAIIYDSVHAQIPPDSEGKGNPWKRLTLNGYALHSPCEYAVGRILIKIASPKYTANSNEDAILVFLSKGDMTFIHEPSLFSDDPDLLDRLVDVCNAKNHDQESTPLVQEEQSSSAPPASEPQIEGLAAYKARFYNEVRARIQTKDQKKPHVAEALRILDKIQNRHPDDLHDSAPASVASSSTAAPDLAPVLRLESIIKAIGNGAITIEQLRQLTEKQLSVLEIILTTRFVFVSEEKLSSMVQNPKLLKKLLFTTPSISTPPALVAQSIFSEPKSAEPSCSSSGSDRIDVPNIWRK